MRDDNDNTEAGEEAARRFVNGVAGTIDDLDNVLYYLLNHYDAQFIRTRLREAAEVHPNEVAKRVFGLPDPEDVERNERQKPNRPLTKVEQARRLLGG